MCRGVTVSGGVRREGAGESSLPLRGEGQGKRRAASIQKTPKALQELPPASSVSSRSPFLPQPH